MIHELESLTGVIVLFGLLLVCAFLGRGFGRWQITKTEMHRLRIINVAEGTVFALFGLLIAFTFAGAYDRFEAREMRIIEEVNALETAYARVGLLAPQTQAGLRESIIEYINSRLAIYQSLTDFSVGNDLVERSRELRAKIWQQTLEACRITHNDAATQLFVPALDNLFEIATTRFAINRIHPPIAVFILLIGLALLSSFLVGYSTSKTRIYNKIYLVSYAFIIAVTIFIIMDLEYPRHGFIRVNAFDHLLVEALDELGPVDNSTVPIKKH